ncbi:hypothetical protein NDU88_005684 [Pleurodeles waltl]|uniref:Uncharacterized protein n=1 Tax=Pleurodeles waltl TaxID=8319 RepID=A0AAV7MX40_PLEWA|nr:hypothetical protein NDU88_005684 [Pleurodeles waltl]
MGEATLLRVSPHRIRMYLYQSSRRDGGRSKSAGGRRAVTAGRPNGSTEGRALELGRPAHRVSVGVAAAVAACSPPRAAGVVKYHPTELETSSEGPHSVVRPQGSRIKKAGALEASAAGKSGGLRKAGALQARAAGALQARAAGALQARAAGAGQRRQARGPKGGPGAIPKRKGLKVAGRGLRNEGGAPLAEVSRAQASGGGCGEGDQRKTDERESERDPRVPIFKKWPTMLQWSSEEEGEGTVGGGWYDGEGPVVDRSLGVPKRAYGTDISGCEVLVEDDGLEEEVLEGEEGPGGLSQWDVESSPGTPDLDWQGPLDYEDDDPGKQDVARLYWEEEKAGPGAASRMASAGRSRRRYGAADASSGLCGGVGFAPP